MNDTNKSSGKIANFVDNDPKELEEKIDKITEKVQTRLNLLLLVPNLISRLLTGVGSIFVSLGEAFNTGTSKKE